MFISIGVLLTSCGLAYAFSSTSRKEMLYINNNIKGFEYASNKVNENIKAGKCKQDEWMAELLRLQFAYQYMKEQNKKNFGSKDIAKRKAYHQKCIDQVKANKDYYLHDWEG